MLPPIPQEIYHLYSSLGFWERWHVRWRWRLCPFTTMAAYIPRELRIADIGCGRGLLANYLIFTDPTRRVLGIDKQERRIAAARSSIRGRSNIDFRLQDVLDLEEEQFDVIVMSDFLHHLNYQQQEKVLKYCHHLLPAAGLLLIEEVGERPVWKWVAHLLIDLSLNLGRKQYYRRPSAWMRLLREIGFETESHPVHEHLPLPDFLMICRKISHLRESHHSVGATSSPRYYRSGDGPPTEKF